jgi:hypothetical protein
MPAQPRLLPACVRGDIRKMRLSKKWKSVEQYANNVKKAFEKHNCKIMIIQAKKGGDVECVLRTGGEYSIELHSPSSQWVFDLGSECNAAPLSHALFVITRLIGGAAFGGRGK